MPEREQALIDRNIDRRTAMITGAGVAAAAFVAVGSRAAPKAAAAPAEPSPAPVQCSSVAQVIAQTTDIPVGGGMILGDVVVTQPTAGDFRAFCATCTHAFCHLSTVADGTIDCHCHGSKFYLNGKVAHGPAFLSLAPRVVRVDGEALVLEPVVQGVDIPCPSLPNVLPNEPEWVPTIPPLS